MRAGLPPSLHRFLPDPPPPESEVLVQRLDWGGAKRYVIRPGRKRLVEPGQHVRAGDVLVEGRLNLHAALEVLGVEAARSRLLDEAVRLCPRSKDVERSHLALLLHPLLDFVRIEEAGDSTFAPGDVVWIRSFTSEIDRVLSLGSLMPVASAVFLGCSEVLERRPFRTE